jgi:LmbE family N-acetylglucosaminyl deacetylase
VQTDLATPSSALVVVAHPDDAEFQCGATLAKWAARGCVVHHLVLTDGSKGTWDPACDQAALVVTRQREQRAAAAALGATGEVVFCGWTDGELSSGTAERAAVAAWIRRLRPEVVLGHDPWRRWRLHPDHRHAGWLATDGVVAARDPFFFAEQGLSHHRPEALLLFECEEPDHAEDVTGWGTAKTAALMCFESQFVTTHEITDPADEAQRRRFADFIEWNLTDNAERAGLADAGIAQAELFRAVTGL